MGTEDILELIEQEMNACSGEGDTEGLDSCLNILDTVRQKAQNEGDENLAAIAEAIIDSY